MATGGYSLSLVPGVHLVEDLMDSRVLSFDLLMCAVLSFNLKIKKAPLESLLMFLQCEPQPFGVAGWLPGQLCLLVFILCHSLSSFRDERSESVLYLPRSP